MPSLNSNNDVKVTISTNADTKGVTDAEKALKSLNATSGDSHTSFLKMGAAVAAGQAAFSAIESVTKSVIGSLKGAAEETTAFAKGTMKLQRELGVSAESASSLLAVFNRFGIDVEGASKNLGIFAKKIEAAAEPGKYAGSVFEELGIKLKETNGTLRTADSVMLDVADKFKAMPNGVEKTAEAMRLFGKSGKDLLPILNLGSKGIQELEAQAKKMGLVLTQDNINAVKKNIVAQKDYKEALAGINVQLGNEVMPILTKFSTFMATTGIDAIRSMIHVVREFYTDHLKPLQEGFKKVYNQVADYLQPKLKDLEKSLEKLWTPLKKFVDEYILPLVKILGPAVGVGLVWALGFVIDVLKDLAKVMTPVFDYLDKHRGVVYTVAAAFTAWGASMALGAAFNAITVAVATFRLVTFPSLMTTLWQLGAAWWAAFPLAAIAAAAAVAFLAIQDGARKTLSAIDNTNRAIASSADSNTAAAGGIRDAYRSGKISREQYIKSTRAALEVRAGGGPVKAGKPYLVGENSDGSMNSTSELFVPNQSGTIVSAKDTQRMLGGSRGLNITQNIYNQIDYNRGFAEIGFRLSQA